MNDKIEYVNVEKEKFNIGDIVLNVFTGGKGVLLGSIEKKRFGNICDVFCLEEYKIKTQYIDELSPVLKLYE